MGYPVKLSIITVNLNNKEGLRKTIDSVISQTCQDFEWIVIDGGSTDGSKELIEKYQDHINYWVSEPDKGIYNAMNKGILASHGEYLLFLNSGDFLFENDVVKKVYNLLSNSDIYIGNQKSIYGIYAPSTDPISLITTIINKTLPHQASFIKRDLLIHAGGYNEKYKIISDWEFFFKTIVINNYTVEKIPFIISEIESGGISNVDKNTLMAEREQVLRNFDRLSKLSQFVTRYHDMIKALTSNKLSYFLFRCYFYFYRMLDK